jgi:hypothetical protein
MSPSLRIRRLIARQGKLEDAAARAQLQILRRARAEILAELPDASTVRRLHLRTILDVIDSFVQAGRQVSEQAAAVHAGQAWNVGVGLADAGLGRSLVGLSRELLDALVDVTRDAMRGVWSDLGTRLKASVRRVVLGIDDPFKAMVAVAKGIKDPFDPSFTRAEFAVRTTVNQTFSVANHARVEQAAQAGLKPKHWWLTAEDNRVREDHVEAGQRYSRDRPIPVDQPFIVGGVPMRYPLDPRAPAEQVVNCRCVEMVTL